MSSTERTTTRQARGRGPVSPTVCVLSKQGRLTVAEPLFERGARRLSIAGKAAGGARVGDLVLVGGGKRGARVIRTLGRPDVARDVLEGLMLDRGLRRAFPRAVELEAEEAAQEVPAQARDGRRDLTRPAHLHDRPGHGQGISTTPSRPSARATPSACGCTSPT